jgi:hypothetical protein
MQIHAKKKCIVSVSCIYMILRYMQINTNTYQKQQGGGCIRMYCMYRPGQALMPSQHLENTPTRGGPPPAPLRALMGRLSDAPLPKSSRSGLEAGLPCAKVALMAYSRHPELDSAPSDAPACCARWCAKSGPGVGHRLRKKMVLCLP